MIHLVLSSVECSKISCTQGRPYPLQGVDMCGHGGGVDWRWNGEGKWACYVKWKKIILNERVEGQQRWQECHFVHDCHFVHRKVTKGYFIILYDVANKNLQGIQPNSVAMLLTLFLFDIKLSVNEPNLVWWSLLQ